MCFLFLVYLLGIPRLTLSRRYLHIRTDQNTSEHGGTSDAVSDTPRHDHARGATGSDAEPTRRGSWGKTLLFFPRDRFAHVVGNGKWAEEYA